MLYLTNIGFQKYRIQQILDLKNVEIKNKSQIQGEKFDHIYDHDQIHTNKQKYVLDKLQYKK